MHNTRMVRSLLLAVLCAMPLAAQATTSTEAVPRSDAETIADALPRIGELLRDGVLVAEPTANIWRHEDRKSVFDGSYDWHSCIAAHWAILCLARVEGDEALSDFVLDRLSPEVLEAERELLDGTGSERLERSRRYFTPYVDAWMVLLLAEIARHEGRDTAELRAFRRETEERVLRALEEGTFPERTPPAERGGKTFCGFYRSWLFGYVMLRIAGPSDEAAQARLDVLAEEKLAPQREALTAYGERHAFDFLHVAALHALAERVDPTVEEPVAFVVPESFEALPAEVTLRTVHPVGVHVTQLWPLAVDARHDPIARAAYERRMAEILARTDLWADDFTVVSHWVPQFLWMAVWLSRGRP